LYDSGNAQFSTSAGARNATAYLNPLSPGGLNPRNTSIPTIVWAVAFVVAAYLIWQRIK
jgi:hypothetical protein